MGDRPIEWRRGDFLVSTNRERLDLAAVLRLLHVTHWGQALTAEVLERALEHSVCFAVYEAA
jgi:hypothetical protein